MKKVHKEYKEYAERKKRIIKKARKEDRFNYLTRKHQSHRQKMNDILPTIFNY